MNTARPFTDNGWFWTASLYFSAGDLHPQLLQRLQLTIGTGELCNLLCDFRGIYHRVWGCIRSCGLSCTASYITFTASQSVGRVKICFILKIPINFNCCLVCFSCHHSCLRAVEARLRRYSLSRELSWVCEVRSASARSGLGPASSSPAHSSEPPLARPVRTPEPPAPCADPPSDHETQTPVQSRCSGPAPHVPVPSDESASLSQIDQSRNAVQSLSLGFSRLVVVNGNDRDGITVCWNHDLSCVCLQCASNHVLYGISVPGHNDDDYTSSSSVRVTRYLLSPSRIPLFVPSS